MKIDSKIIHKLVDILLKFDTEIIFKNLILLNNCTKIGKFALTYKDKLHKYIDENNYTNIKKLFSKHSTPEYDNNEFLNDNFIKLKDELIQEQLQILHLLFDNHKFGINATFESCQNEICLFYGKNNNNSSVVNFNINESEWCFSLPKLLIIILTDNINPYTGKKIPNNIKNNILNEYKFESLLIQKYLSL